MLAHKHVGKVSGLVPLGFAGHLVEDLPSVDLQVLEVDILYPAIFVITRHDGHARMTAPIGDVA